MNRKSSIPIINIFIYLIAIITGENLFAETYENLYSIETDKVIITFSETGANPVLLTSFYNSRKVTQTSSTFTTPKDSVLLRVIVSDDPVLNRRLNELKYTVDREENDLSIVVRFTSEHIYGDIYFERIYNINKQSYLIEAIFRICGEGAAEFAKSHIFKMITGYGTSFIPVGIPGFSGSMEKPRWIYIHENKVNDVHEVLERGQSLSLRRGHWAGFRNRFWTFLIQPEKNSVLLERGSDTCQTQMYYKVPFQPNEFSFRIYAGPIEYSGLKNETPDLSILLFPHVWFWLRWLCLGMLFLCNFLIQLAKCHGIAIILLSVCVKVIMIPLVKIAERWQEEVNEKKSRLQPLVDEIKAKYKGEEQNRKILELHKQQNISPLFTLKSLFSALIQIPFFIAAYDMLSENIALRGVGFLWIEDLSLPDRIIHLPFYIPFFGEYLNLLPLLMTAITLLTSCAFRDSSLSKILLQKQRRNLYIMAALFFILFYTFPAGMVLYWTTNNTIALIKTLKGKNGIR